MPQMGPRLRKAFLTLHILVAVGWMGSIAAYIALDVKAATSDDPSTLRAAYVAMGWVARQVVLQLGIASVVTGVILSLFTKWGLLRHYWVIISLILTLVAVAVLIVELGTIEHQAGVAADPAATDDQIRALGHTLPHSAGGFAVLLVVLVLNMYKPRGLTRYGWRKQQQALKPAAS